MALTDRPRLARIVEQVEDFTGFAVRPKAQVERWQVVEREFVELANDAEDLALHSMDYLHGRPQEMATERRRRIAQRSRIALKFDPLAAAEAQLLADFSFGRGVPIPTARDEKVQDVIDAAWTDANNEEKLTGFAAQRKLSNELLTAGERFTTLYTAGGRVRVGRIDPDLVEAVVPDPEDRLRPIYYMAQVRKYEWDTTLDQPKTEQIELENGRPKVKYWPHWRNLDDAKREREDGLIEADELPLPKVPPAKLAKGRVYHTAINQTGEELRGNPPWARSLRFFSAMNVLVEAHVVKAQASTAFVAKQMMKGSPKTITRAAASVMGHVSELGASRFDPAGRRPGTSEGTAAFAPGAGPPPPPGSWWAENESSRLESLELKSGAGEMAQTAQIVRAPIAAAAGFGQHYLGDSSDANLATASTLELPATMRVQSWQQYAEEELRWFTDRAIEAAAHAGQLGGVDDFPEDGPLGEMYLHEAEDRRAMEKRTGRDLSYEFVMPFPGRRQLADVQAFIVGMSQSMDPNGVNVPLRRHLLRFAFEQIGIDDIGGAIEECLPEEGLPGGIGPQPPEPELDPETHEPIIDPDTGRPRPSSEPAGSTAPVQITPKVAPGDRPARVKRGTTVGGKRTSTSEQEWIPEDLRADVSAFGAESGELFTRLVAEPAVLAALQLAAAGSNGNGSGE